MTLPDCYNCTIAVIGLGYVGLPLAVELAKKKSCLITKKNISRKVIGFDINQNRIEELINNLDKTLEISSRELASVKIEYTSDIYALMRADIYIVTVPTPINKNKNPDLNPLRKATEMIGEVLGSKYKLNPSLKSIVIYESTVYPTATDEFCVPILEKTSHLTYNHDFFCGYSPERINPGDAHHSLPNIVKVTSGSTIETADWVDKLYGSIIKAGTFRASSIKTAEAAKVIENTQRDLNIALINEFTKIFNLLDIDTLEVLEAAGTKWNFLPFRPGLVGGHCIGVDPYYLTHKAQELGYFPDVVLSGRRINDNMPFWYADQILKELIKRKIEIYSTKVLVLGFTFKEDCPDFRNTKVIDLVTHLASFGIDIEIVDPRVDINLVRSMYNVNINSSIHDNVKYSVIVGAVAHTEFKSLANEFIEALLLPNGFVFDLKGIFINDNKKVVRV